MNKLSPYLNERKVKGQKILSLFATAGFPEIAATAPLVVAMAHAGADLIEIGIPFSDPVADGPIIQHGSEVALRNGISVAKIFDIIRQVKKETDIPLVLMGYANPIFSYGMERFLDDCASTGVGGTIVADLPYGEHEEYSCWSEQRSLATIFLAAPTTSDERLKMLDRASTGFLYCVSITGVTGERPGLASHATQFLRHVRQCATANAILVGFGITTPADVRLLASESDGVVIGSALMKCLSDSTNGQVIRSASGFVKTMRSALDSGEP